MARENAETTARRGRPPTTEDRRAALVDGTDEAGRGRATDGADGELEHARAPLEAAGRRQAAEAPSRASPPTPSPRPGHADAETTAGGRRRSRVTSPPVGAARPTVVTRTRRRAASRPAGPPGELA